MVDIVITPANLVPGANAVTEQGVAGVAITAGQLVYREAATGKYKLSDADSATVEARTVRGIATHGAAANQPLVIQTKGLITIGGTVAAGTPYFASATAGGICPAADLVTGMYATFLGFGQSASVLDVNFTAAGVVKP